MIDERIHEKEETLYSSTLLKDASVAVLLMHGRGATPESLLELTKQLPTDGVAYVLPRAAQNRWYPNSGFAPFEVNQPDLASAWNTMHEHLQMIAEAGIPPEQTIIGGFSQGACLASEFVARHPQRFGGLLVLSGALMGDETTDREYDDELNGTPVFIGGADQDPWVTGEQLQQTAQLLRSIGGDVTIIVHKSKDHAIRETDVFNARDMINDLL